MSANGNAKAARYRARKRGIQVPKLRTGPKATVPSCHPERKHVAIGMCSACYARHKRRQNPEHARAQNRKFQQSHKSERYQGSRRWYAGLSPERKFLLKNSAIKKEYGITAQEYMERKAKQGNRCAICGSITKLHLDHDHTTKQLRDFICPPCNLTLGKIEKYGVVWVNNLVAYLGKWKPHVSPGNRHNEPVICSDR